MSEWVGGISSTWPLMEGPEFMYRSAAVTTIIIKTFTILKKQTYFLRYLDQSVQNQLNLDESWEAKPLQSPVVIHINSRSVLVSQSSVFKGRGRLPLEM